MLTGTVCLKIAPIPPPVSEDSVVSCKYFIFLKDFVLILNVGRNCVEPSCPGGGCIFEKCSHPSCRGGGCQMIQVKTTLTDGYCEGGSCSVDGKEWPSSFSNDLSM